MAEDYDGVIPEGLDVITLPESDDLMFQGEPFAEEDYCNAIFAVQTAMDGYEPSVIGCGWDDLNSRIQLEPRGERGYWVIFGCGSGFGYAKITLLQPDHEQG